MVDDKVFTFIVSNDSVFILKSISKESAIIAARYDKEESMKVTLREVVEFLCSLGSRLNHYKEEED